MVDEKTAIPGSRQYGKAVEEAAEALSFPPFHENLIGLANVPFYADLCAGKGTKSQILQLIDCHLMALEMKTVYLAQARRTLLELQDLILKSIPEREDNRDLAT